MEILGRRDAGSWKYCALVGSRSRILPGIWKIYYFPNIPDSVRVCFLRRQAYEIPVGIPRVIDLI